MSGPLSKYHHSTSSLSLLSTNVGHYIGDGDTSIAGVAKQKSVVTGPNNELENRGIDQIGNKYTRKQFTVTHLLQILHDAAAPSLLHQECQINIHSVLSILRDLSK
jgi:hypothetical protein